MDERDPWSASLDERLGEYYILYRATVENREGNKHIQHFACTEDIGALLCDAAQWIQASLAINEGLLLGLEEVPLGVTIFR